MYQVTVLGGTGYAGAAIAAEAAQRGHQVRSISRRPPAADQSLPKVAYLTGSVAEPAFLDAAVAESDAVIVSLSPRGEMLGQVRRVCQELIALADRLGFRLGVVLGGGSLLLEDGSKLIDQPFFPDEVKEESQEMADVLDDLLASPAGVDWFGVSPSSRFGALCPGAPTGHYLTGLDHLMHGDRVLAVQDFALAVIDELDQPSHKRQRFAVAAA
jgi:putative NADH-flavin reductase